MANLDLARINDTAKRVQEVCKHIAETEDVIEDLLQESATGLRLHAVVSGYSQECDNEGNRLFPPKRLDLGDEHKAWVIQHLRQRVLGFQNELREIGQFV